MAVVVILAAIAVPTYRSYRTNSFDAAAKSDLRNAMTAIEAAIASGDELPASAEALQQYGHRLSPGVSFTKYSVGTKDGEPTVHMHTKHNQSPNAWHANYPAEGANIEIR